MGLKQGWRRAAATGGVLLGLLALWAGLLHPQPVRQGVIEDVSVHETPETVSVTVGFPFLVLYLDHTPPSSGDELRVRFRRIPLGEEFGEEVYRRESVVLPARDGVPEIEVIYEGDVGRVEHPDLGGDVRHDPWLTFRFERPVAFAVSQGRDFRSIVVTLPRAGAVF